METYADKIEGWFPKENQFKLDELIREHEIKDVIEIGSFVGKSTAFFAERVLRVWAVDPFIMWPDGKAENGTAIQYGDDFYVKFLENMAAAGVLSKIGPIRMTSREAAENVFNTPADLVYIDGQHDYKSVKEDIKLFAPFAKKFICGDDYDENWPGVIRAVDEIYPQRLVYGNLWIAPIVGI